jgi:3D (Asp-Asp-Asp) domain-containing protein
MCALYINPKIKVRYYYNLLLRRVLYRSKAPHGVGFLLLFLGMFSLFNGGYKKTVSSTSEVLGISVKNIEDVSTNPISIKYKSSFSQKDTDEYESISFPKERKNDPNLEYGTEKVVQEGINGKKTSTYKVTYWKNDEITKDLVKVSIDEPVAEITQVGTKVVWRDIKTELGTLKYWRKLHVFATKYDGNCPGCRGLTYSGTLVRKGVCAVDPKVISLGTNFYVEGYGMCRSEDIGGLIKGNRIDLGFEDAKTGNWYTRWTDIYLLTSSPDE